MNISFGIPNYKISQNIQNNIPNKTQTKIIDSKLTNNLNKNVYIDRYFDKNNNNLQFETKKIKFFKEDEEKMANMSLQDKINYKIKLKNENRYTIL